MHKYFNFSKIYEAEQMGDPLSPEEMGTPSQSTVIKPEEDVLKDFNQLAGDHLIEITLTQEDLRNLKDGQSVTKTDAQWKNKTGDQTSGIIDIKSIIINTKNDTAKNDKDALVFNIDDPNLAEGVTKRILDDFERPETSEHLEVLKGTAQDGTEIPEISVKFLRSTEPDTSTTNKEAVPASPEQIESGAVLPNAVSGIVQNESESPKKIMSFNQFVNEGKKKWIGEIDMKKGALKKEMKDDKLSMADLNKEEAKLKKKDKDKKKPGLQLDAKDAKTRKRVTLAKNLMKASGASKK
jgi:hypothetical protein